jgi:hypothetical protein
MISSKIMVKQCSVMAPSGYVYDTLGSPVSSFYSTVTSGIPCYYSETGNSTLEGKEPIRNVYIMYINGDSVDVINTSYKVYVDNKYFDILNIEEAHLNSHLELTIKNIEI